MERGECVGAPPSMFYPDAGEGGQYVSTYRKAAVKARATYCNHCEVRQMCLEYAMSSPGIDGIWGGTTPEERDSLRKLRRRKQ